MKQQRYKILTITLLGCALCCGGCMSPEGRPDYTATGALEGGAAGAIIGSMARHPGPGALVGAAVGAVLGGAIGHGEDQSQAAYLQSQAPQTWQRVEQGQPLAVEDVKALTKAGVTNDLIISQIRNSHTVYRLNTEQIIDLKNSGVSEAVIDFMINTPGTAQMDSTTATVQQAPAVQQVVVTPYPYAYYPYYPGYYWPAPVVWGWGWGWHGGGHGGWGGGHGHWR